MLKNLALHLFSKNSTNYIINLFDTKSYGVINKNSEEYLTVKKSIYFDGNWYKNIFLNNSEEIDPVAHYIVIGWKLNLPPSINFSSMLYIEEMKKKNIEIVNPLLHYERNINDTEQTIDVKSFQYEIILNSGMFEAEWYKKEFLEGNSFEVDALLHYLQNSKSLNVAPCKDFSSKCYYEQYKDVLDSEFDALFHYIIYGKNENRVVRNYDYQLIKQSKYFNSNKYIENNNLDETTDAVEHYLNNFNSVEFVSSNFDSQAYLDQYSDVKDANIPPLLHFVKYGYKEGRNRGVFSSNSDEYIYNSNDALNIKHKRALILAGFLQNGIIEDYKLYLIEQLSLIVDSIYLICDSPIDIQRSNFNKIKKFIRFAQFKRHGKYDFGSYQIGFQKIRDDEYYNQYEQILLANDSILGPVGNLDDFIKFANESPADAIGLVANQCGYRDKNSSSWASFSYHIQSYFVLLKKDVYTSIAFADFIDSVKKEENKIDIVINYEMGLTKHLLENNFKIDTFYKSEIKINPSANDSINLLLQGHFIKMSMISANRYSDTCINTIFKNKKFPFKIKNNKVYNTKTSKLSTMISRRNVEIINIYKDCNNYYFLVYNNLDNSHNLQLNILNKITAKTMIFDNNKEDFYNFYNIKSQLENSNNNQTRIPLLFKIPNQLLDSIDEGYMYFSDDSTLFGLTYLSNSSIYKNNHLESSFFTLLIGNHLFFTKKCNTYKKYLESNNANNGKLQKVFNMQNINRSYILFAEKDDLTSDNSYSLFRYILLSDNLLKHNVFYITSEHVYDLETNPLIKSHLVIRNSDKHYDLFYQMLIGVFSFDMRYLIPNQITRYELSILYKYQKYIMISHGYTGGYNNTAAVGALYYGKSDMVVSSSSFEYEHFKYMGYDNVLLLGYPRFDKWNDNNILLKDDEITFFFTFRRALLGMDLEDLLNSEYVDSVKSVVNCVHKEFPQMRINYIFHNALSNPFKELLGGILLNICDKITLIDNSDHLTFNTVLSTSKYFITDYSSAGFDMSYDTRKNVFFYIEPKFLDGHYKLSESFEEQALLANINITNTEDELIKAIHKNINESSIRNNKLFKYSDNKNSERCANAIINYIVNNNLINNGLARNFGDC